MIELTEADYLLAEELAAEIIAYIENGDWFAGDAWHPVNVHRLDPLDYILGTSAAILDRPAYEPCTLSGLVGWLVGHIGCDASIDSWDE